MTKNRTLLAVLALVAFTGIALAQTVTNAPPAASGTALPASIAEFWVLGIAAVTPLIVGAVYKWVPELPSVLVPVSTPVIGMVLGAAINYLGKTHLGWLDMAQAGALAVFVRETWNQAVTKRLQPPSATTASSATSTGTVAPP